MHKILERAININEISQKYGKEVRNSWEIAKAYREKINPVGSPLLGVDAEEIKRKISNKVRNELKLRIDRGYKNISLELVDDLVFQFLKELKII